ncbi:helix-turn-helix domain-containing protein [Salmonirosea aquatica]|uniref:Helix-turn-helix domain-containing protein n=1 Tax=Salmonirosea aquatica TaxID=2654236 RepID=A0A7C9F2B7_9BACT|nr:helix-turn-helix domain-containing protein [Cytophagaceae bacterium SJW1-29]
MGIPERIKAIREGKRIKQIDVATSLNLDPSYYARLEKRGSKMTLDQLQSIADALGVSLGEVLGIESNTDKVEKAKVKALEHRIMELEELASLHRERYDKLMGAVSWHIASIITEVREEMTEMAFKKGFLNESNIDGYFVMEKNEDGTYKDFYFDESLDEKYDLYLDFFISNLLTEQQLIQLMHQLSAHLMEGLSFIGNADLFTDNKLKRAYNMMTSEIFGKESRLYGEKENETS